MRTPIGEKCGVCGTLIYSESSWLSHACEKSDAGAEVEVKELNYSCGRCGTENLLRPWSIHGCDRKTIDKLRADLEREKEENLGLRHMLAGTRPTEMTNILRKLKADKATCVEALEIIESGKVVDADWKDLWTANIDELKSIAREALAKVGK